MEIKEFFCILSGDDYSIIKQCRRSVRNQFVAIGVFVFTVFVLCFVSGYFTFTKMFQNYWIGIPAGLFCAFMVTNIYLLMLYTLSKNVLPHTKSVRAKIISTGLRLLFICFIAVVVSKPIEALIFTIPLNDEIVRYKEEKLLKYTAVTMTHFDNEVIELRKIIANLEKLSDKPDVLQLRKYQSMIEEKEAEKRELILKMNRLVENSNYYIQSIVILNSKYPQCWLMTAIIVVVFIVPAYLKYVLPIAGAYNNSKKDIETRLITQEYELFRVKYNALLRLNYGADKQYNELFTDAPFNTVLKRDERSFLRQDDLLAEIYDA